MSELHGAHIHITGIVQGVGFRPFVYGLATRLALAGWVRNTSAGVDIEIDGTPAALAAFVESLRAQAPPLAHIDTLQVEPREPNGFAAFEIFHSESWPDASQPIAPDVGICPDCLRELFDPADRRYHYSFINCTNCGPRFTIIKDLPYDRPYTTMAPFEMCPDCAAEYADPLNRRFHAQPVACPKCGPQVWLVRKSDTDQHGQTPLEEAVSMYPCLSVSSDSVVGNTAILEARRLLAQGKIVAIKGLGGFHLACDATNDAAVAELRRRKGRVDKALALMLPDLETIEQFCAVNTAERALLQSSQRPIVLLNKPANQSTNQPTISLHVAPGQATLGVMLPYTPLHYLLFDEGWMTDDESSSSVIRLSSLVMTSGNFSEEPIATDNDDALERLAPLADAFLLHNRDIHIRCDDSVVRVSSEQSSLLTAHCSLPTLFLRRSRGYAPYPVRLPLAGPPALATGAELKNTFCVTRDAYAFVSHHIGDMENYETLRSFEAGVAHFERLFRIQPEVIAHDLHPNYLATRYALERAERAGLRAIGVQHHHAHIAACLVENGLSGEQPVIGVAFDGTGYGSDGAIWGGEFLIADYARFERSAHLAYAPLPGGDAATRNPYRMALSYLRSAGLEWTNDLAPVATASLAERAAIARQLESGLNAPLTSSLGRLFDAVASLAGVRQAVNYEGQAAIELEALADKNENGYYGFEIDGAPGERCSVSVAPVIRAVVKDVRAGVPAPIISARFHTGIANMVRDVCVLIRDARGLNEVALSGGVFQNVTLLTATLKRLHTAGFTVYTHRLVPPNDGGLALGQAAIAISNL
ncbi:MAG TPA: carbamoyltransferase HypF [Anaerolineae bacterium]|nr:carbamoyltransferase HypF [Anaerolineae bacterium]